MIVVGRVCIDDFKMKHSQSGELLDAWERKLRRGKYKGFSEIRKTFPSADFIYHKYTVFNPKNCSWITISAATS